jgi:SAM-dependent methyltransferase
MTVLDDPGFRARGCPSCASTDNKALLRMSRDEICRGNWSYREISAALRVSSTDLFPINECLSCGFVYAGLLPGADLLRTIYDEIIDVEAAEQSNLSAGNIAAKMGYLATLLRLLPTENGAPTILDFGCGFGTTLDLLTNVASLKTVGYEISEARLQALRQRHHEVTGSLDKVQSRGPYDAIILDNVLEHLPNPREAMAFVRAISKKRAILFVSVPQFSKVQIEDARGRLETGAATSIELNPWEHLNYFELRSLDSLISDYGFAPLSQADLPCAIDVGLRPSPKLALRCKNGLASVARLCAYVWSGNGLVTVNSRFYRMGADSFHHQ